MLKSTTQKRAALALALAAALGTAVALPGVSAHADPQQYSAFVGTGSDTLQDVVNAYAGYTNGVNYTPIQSTAGQQIISFDALAPAGVADNCITTKLNGPSYYRPAGSSAGRKSLFASSGLSVAGWTGSGGCGTAVDISGQIDFARSSSGPSSGDLGTDITYIPIGRDAMSFAYYRTAGSPVTDLTRAQLTSLFTTGPQVIGGVRLVPCGIQKNSGTYSFWQKVTTASASAEVTATTECNALFGGDVAGRAEENHGDQLQARGDAIAALPGHSGDQVVIGFSAGSFISKANGAAPGLNALAQMGSISNNGSGINLGLPLSGTAPTLVPSASFYADSVFGRDIYIVLPTTVATGPGNAQIKSLFVGVGSAVCTQNATLNKFGFLANVSCGSTALKGTWITGAS